MLPALYLRRQLRPWSVPPSLPTFFGRATAAFAEHEQLEAVLRELRALTTGSAPPATRDPAGTTALLQRLRAALSSHFRAEETDGYFGTLAGDNPALLPTIAQLRGEHTQMLESVDALIVLASDPEQARELESAVAVLIGRFQAHEHTESELVREYLLRASEMDAR